MSDNKVLIYDITEMKSGDFAKRLTDAFNAGHTLVSDIVLKNGSMYTAFIRAPFEEENTLEPVPVIDPDDDGTVGKVEIGPNGEEPPAESSPENPGNEPEKGKEDRQTPPSTIQRAP